MDICQTMLETPSLRAFASLNEVIHALGSYVKVPTSALLCLTP